MFPTLQASLSGLAPEVYFGGVDVPPYFRRPCASGITPEEVVREVRMIMTDHGCSGYVAPDGIYLHLFGEEEEIQCDLSREFVVIADRDGDRPVVPTAWQVLRFLQEPARKALWIGRRQAVCTEKTPRTMILCEELDRIWQEDAFLPLVQEAVINAEAYDQLLPALMTRYEERTAGEASLMWRFYDTFGPLLVRERLHLSLQVIDPP